MESFCRSAEGKSDGFVLVVTVLHAWSAISSCQFHGNGRDGKEDKPRFSAPQQSQERTFFSLPLDAGSKLPQSVQKIKEPIAAIVCAV